MSDTTPADPRRWTSDDFCYLTTAGRRTGIPHTIEIWFALDPDDATHLAMMAGGGERSDWVRNLRQTADVTIKLGPFVYPATAETVAPDDPDDPRIRAWLVGKYRSSNQPLTEWGRTALPVRFILRPDAANPVQ